MKTLHAGAHTPSNQSWCKKPETQNPLLRFFLEGANKNARGGNNADGAAECIYLSCRHQST